MTPSELVQWMRQHLDAGRTPEAARPAAALAGEDEVRGELRGVPVTFRLARHSSSLWTQVDVTISGPVLHFALRPQTASELEHVAAERGTDVLVGDAELDDAFVVEAAPAEVIRAVLDAPICKRLLALRPLTVEPIDGGFRIEKSGWLTDTEVAREMLDVGATLGERVPAAFRDVELRRGSYRLAGGAPGPHRDGAAEVAAVAARALARKKHQELVGCVTVIAIVLGAMLLSYCASHAGYHVDPNDTAAP